MRKFWGSCLESHDAGRFCLPTGKLGLHIGHRFTVVTGRKSPHASQWSRQVTGVTGFASACRELGLCHVCPGRRVARKSRSSHMLGRFCRSASKWEAESVTGGNTRAEGAKVSLWPRAATTSVLPGSGPESRARPDARTAHAPRAGRHGRAPSRVREAR